MNAALEIGLNIPEFFRSFVTTSKILTICALSEDESLAKSFMAIGMGSKLPCVILIVCIANACVEQSKAKINIKIRMVISYFRLDVGMI